MVMKEILSLPSPLDIVHVNVASPSKFAAGKYMKPPCSSYERIPVLGKLQLSTLKTSSGPTMSFSKIPGALTMRGCPG